MLHTYTLRATMAQAVTLVAETTGSRFELCAYREPAPGESPDPDGAHDLLACELDLEAVRALHAACARHLAALGASPLQPLAELAAEG